VTGPTIDGARLQVGQLSTKTRSPTRSLAKLSNLPRPFTTSRVASALTTSDADPGGDAALAYRVKSALAAYRQDEHLDKLADSLRKKCTVRVYEARLADVIKTEKLR
jgi:hypothetical protein